MIKILIVDDNARFRERIVAFLCTDPEIEVVGVVKEGEEAVVQARKLKPDIILMDLRMAGMNGLIATELIKEELPETHIIVLSMHELDAYQTAARNAGASAFVIKKNLVKDLLPVIRSLAFG